jgi:hypothetical protein
MYRVHRTNRDTDPYLRVVTRCVYVVGAGLCCFWLARWPLASYIPSVFYVMPYMLGLALFGTFFLALGALFLWRREGVRSLLPLGLVCALMGSWLAKPHHPSDAALGKRYTAHRADFARLAVLLTEDSITGRRDACYVRRDGCPSGTGPAHWATEARLREYRHLFRRIGLPQGAEPESAMIVLPVDQWGIFIHADTKGYVYSPHGPTPLVSSLDQVPACKQSWYKRLEGSWYLFYYCS